MLSEARDENGDDERKDLKKKLADMPALLSNINSFELDQPPRKKVRIESQRKHEVECDSLDGIDDGDGEDNPDERDSSDDSEEQETDLSEKEGGTAMGNEKDEAGIALEEYRQRLRDKLANVEHVRGVKSQAKNTGRIDSSFVDRMVEDEAVGTFVICAFFFFFQL
jgi:hypothetical protein